MNLKQRIAALPDDAMVNFTYSGGRCEDTYSVAQLRALLDGKNVDAEYVPTEKDLRGWCEYCQSGTIGGFDGGWVCCGERATQCKSGKHVPIEVDNKITPPYIECIFCGRDKRDW